jgi:hypothetical protein
MGISGALSSAAAAPGALNGVRAYGNSLFVTTDQLHTARVIQGLPPQPIDSIYNGGIRP